MWNLSSEINSYGSFKCGNSDIIKDDFLFSYTENDLNFKTLKYPFV